MKTPLPLAVGLFLLVAPIILNAQSTVTGRITGEAGAPLVGVNILIAGTERGTITDLSGIFELEVPAGTRAVLQVSYIGYETQVIDASGVSSLTIQMIPQIQELAESVVVGYGSQTRRKLTSSVASATSEVFENQTDQNFEGALAGRISGLRVQQNSGVIGSQVVLRVRGISSLNAGNQPLIVIDGLILSDDLTGFTLGNAGTNPLLNIDPNDIASVEVLKDAAAASIYGSRGANGVILITTKSGQFNSRPRVSIHSQAGFSESTKLPDLLSGQEYAALWNRAAAASGFPENSGFYYDVEQQANTDWMDLITHRGFQQAYSAQVSGGTDQTRYFISGSYKDQDGYVRRTNLKRYSFRANLEQMIGEKVRAGLNISPSITATQRLPEDGAVIGSPFSSAHIFFPNVEAYDEEGNIRGGLISTDIGFRLAPGTPLVNLEETDDLLSKTQVLLNTFLSYTPFPHLELRTDFAVESSQLREDLKSSSRTTFGSGIGGYGASYAQHLLNYNWTAQAKYNQVFSRIHDLSAEAGFTLTRESLKSTFLDGSAFANDRLNLLGSAANLLDGGTSRTDVAFVGVFARANYFLKGKYLFTASARYDGSSRFGKNNLYGFFPAFSAGWILSEESFFQSNWLTLLKLRAGIGWTGNADIGNFNARGLVSFDPEYEGQPGMRLSNLENSDLAWEKNRQWNVALDFHLFANRIRGTLEYYQRDTRDMLMEVRLPFTSGFQEFTQNAGSLWNRGLEFNLSADLIRQRFQWTVDFNGATLQTRITRLVDNDRDGKDDDIVIYESIIRAGEPVGTFYLVEYAGVDPQTGDALFYDLEGNKIPQALPSNRVINGTFLPRFSGGMTNRFRYAGFELSLHINFATGHKMFRLEAQRMIENNLSSPYNQLASQYNAWSPENPEANIPEARLFQNNGAQLSTRYLDEADFLRLKEARLAYQFPRAGRQQMRIGVYLSANNLFTLTNYDGLDPETSTTTSPAGFFGAGYGTIFTQPQARIFSFGVNLDF